MTIIACPKCAESVVLPDRASRLATVRCPLCQEEFPLAEALGKLPPTLIVVEDPEPVVASAAPRGWSVSQDSDELALLPADDVSGFAPLSIETDSERAPASAASTRRRPGVAARKRKPKNPLMEGVKIVLGGVAGLAIAQVILWWVGSSQAWPKQRADMFQLAPKVARFVPWVVPERYRSERPATSAADASAYKAGTVALDESSSVRPQEIPERTFIDPNASSDTRGAERAGPAAKKKTGRPVGGDGFGLGGTGAAAPNGPAADMAPAATSEVDLGQVPELDDSSLDDLNLDMLADDEPIADPVVMPVEGLEQAAEPEPVTEPEPSAEPLPKAARTTAAELRSAVEEARTAFAALQASQEADIRPLLRQTYPVLAKLGETAAFAAPRGDEWQVANDLLRTVIAEEETLSMLGRVGGGWLKAPTRDNNGVLLVGTVKQVHRQGGYHVTELLISGSDRAIAVYSDTAPREVHPPGTQLVVMGAVISDPSSELEGYDGDADYVVWQGLAEQTASP